MKRALAYINGPRPLKDFIWYYLAYGKEYTWDLVCQPMVKEMKLEEICRRSGLFENIFVPDSLFYQPKGKLVRIGLKMTAYWVLGQSKRYARREINKITDINQYDHMCLSTTVGVTCGLMALCADNNVTIDLLEHGLGDITDSHTQFDFSRICEKNYLVAYAFAKMGYFNFNGLFPLKSMKKCNRFSEQPDMLSKELYKSVQVLNDMSLIDKNKYKSFIDRTFGCAEIGADIKAVLFTATLIDFTENYNQCIIQTLNYLKEQGYKKILLKRHPRDFAEYQCDGIEVVEVDPMIPGENVIDMLKGQKVYFMSTSTTMWEVINKNIELSVFKYKLLDASMLHTHHFETDIKYMNLNDYSKFRIIEI